MLHINLEPGTGPYIQKGLGPRFSRVGFKVPMGQNGETLTPRDNAPLQTLYKKR
ncbi:hypothetical protein Hanom_Chr14g01321631 [Helianthus anomalus]